MTTLVKNAEASSPLSRSMAVLLAWLKMPGQVASVCPSSPVLTRRIADRDCIRAASLVVDLGPGTGGTTRALLDHMRSDGRMLAIEMTEPFIAPLDAIGDPRLIVQHGDASALQDHLRRYGLGRPDVIVSGIPFSTLDENVAGRLMKSIYDTLPSGGVFIAYQLRSDVAEYAQPLFGQPVVETVLWNIPPLRIYRWSK